MWGLATRDDMLLAGKRRLLRVFLPEAAFLYLLAFASVVFRWEPTCTAALWTTRCSGDTHASPRIINQRTVPSCCSCMAALFLGPRAKASTPKCSARRAVSEIVLVRDSSRDRCGSSCLCPTREASAGVARLLRTAPSARDDRSSVSCPGRCPCLHADFIAEGPDGVWLALSWFLASMEFVATLIASRHFCQERLLDRPPGCLALARARSLAALLAVA